jgi:hypothetical protein
LDEFVTCELAALCLAGLDVEVLVTADDDVVAVVCALA